MSYRRDFLRENKLSLKELQKVTSNKTNTREQEAQQRIQKQQAQHNQKNLALVAQNGNHHRYRSNSQQRNSHQKESTPVAAAHSYNHQVNGRRSRSQQRALAEQQYVAHYENELKGVASHTLSVDKEMQTEDIQDEDFLYKALKK